MPQTEPDSDPQEATTDFVKLLRDAQQGDVYAQETLVTRIYPKVEELVHRELEWSVRRNHDWASQAFSTGDIVHNVFLRVLPTIEELQGENEASLIAYLATAVRNRVLDALRYHQADRRDARRVRSGLRGALARAAFAPDRTPSEHAAIREQLGIFRSVLRTFPARHQSLLRRRIIRRNTFIEIAKSMAFPSPDAARKAFDHANAKMLIRLRACGFQADSRRET